VGALEERDAIAIETLRSEGRDAALARLRATGDDVLVLSDRYLRTPADRLVGGEAVS
jgi:hypothetical protein